MFNKLISSGGIGTGAMVVETQDQMAVVDARPRVRLATGVAPIRRTGIVVLP